MTSSPALLPAKMPLNRLFYLIPDGNGHWKFTDPRKDRDRVTTINVQNNGNVLNVIRAVKYWQRRPTMPSMSSYLLETLILDYYAGRTSCSSFVDMELEALFRHLGQSVRYSVNNPKGIQGDINSLSAEHVRRYRTDVISMRKRYRRRDGLKIIKSMKNPSINGAMCSGHSFPVYG